MKKLLKKIDYKLLFVIIILILLEIVAFFLTKPFIQNPYVLGSNLDNKIPFIPQFIWIYVFWYFMLIAVPYYVAKNNTTSFYKYAITFVITTLISGIIFVVFPNTVIRANVQGTDIASKLVKIIYLLDTPAINCLPSIHCLFSYLFIFAIFDTKETTPTWMKLIITTLSILVIFSTLFIKQHVIYDAVAAFAIGGITWITVNKLKLYSSFEKIYKRIC